MFLVLIYKFRKLVIWKGFEILKFYFRGEVLVENVIRFNFLVFLSVIFLNWFFEKSIV